LQRYEEQIIIQNNSIFLLKLIRGWLEQGHAGSHTFEDMEEPILYAHNKTEYEPAQDGTISKKSGHPKRMAALKTIYESVNTKMLL